MHFRECKHQKELCFLSYVLAFFFVEPCGLSISSDGEQNRDELNSSIQVSTRHSSLDESIEWKKVEFSTVILTVAIKFHL